MVDGLVDVCAGASRPKGRLRCLCMTPVKRIDNQV